MVFIKKGQIGMEFMLVLVMALLTLIVIIIILSVVFNSNQEEVAFFKAEDFSKSISRELFLASETEFGYTRFIDFPSTIGGKNYFVLFNITPINTSYVEVYIDDSIFFHTIPKVLILENGSFFNERNINSGNKLKILNNDSIIILEVVN